MTCWTTTVENVGYLKMPSIRVVGPSSPSYGFSNSHVWMWELDYKESWVLKNWCFWTVVLEKTLESPLDNKEIKPVHPKVNQSWMFLRRTVAEAEAPILWPPEAKNWLTGEDPDVWKDWRQEEKGMTEDEMVGWYHWLNGHEFEQALGVGDGQGSLAFCNPWGRKELDMTKQLNWTEDSGNFSSWEPDTSKFTAGSRRGNLLVKDTDNFRAQGFLSLNPVIRYSQGSWLS